MNWYKDNFNEWKEIIETVARETGRNDYFTRYAPPIHSLSTTL